MSTQNISVHSRSLTSLEKCNLLQSLASLHDIEAALENVRVLPYYSASGSFEFPAKCIANFIMGVVPHLSHLARISCL